MPAIAEDRLPAAAAGAIALALALQITISRFAGDWGSGVRFVILAIGAAVVLAMLWSSARPGAVGVGQTAFIVAGLILFLGALSEFADIIGGDASAAGTITWVSLVFAGFAGYLGWRYRSAVAALFSALAGIVMVLAFVQWVFEPDGRSTFRYVLLLVTIALLAAAFAKRADSTRHAAQFGIAAGVAALIVAGTLAAGLVSNPFAAALGGGRGFDVSTGWEIYLLVTGVILVVLAMLDSQPGVGYAGGFVLAVFSFFAAIPDTDGPSLIGWPILLLIPAIGLIGYAIAGSGGPRSPNRTAPAATAPAATAPDTTVRDTGPRDA